MNALVKSGREALAGRYSGSASIRVLATVAGPWRLNPLCSRGSVSESPHTRYDVGIHETAQAILASTEFGQIVP